MAAGLFRASRAVPFLQPLILTKLPLLFSTQALEGVAVGEGMFKLRLSPFQLPSSLFAARRESTLYSSLAFCSNMLSESRSMAAGPIAGGVRRPRRLDAQISTPYL